MRTMLSVLKPGTRFDFMGLRKRAFMFSGALTVISILLLAFKGFNFGIEFAGGSSAIVAFEQGAVPERDAIGASINKVLVEKLKMTNSQVSVQDFGAGTGDTIEGRPVTRFLIYSEATSLVDGAGRERIMGALNAKYKDAGGIKVASSEDAGDTMYLTFGTDGDIAARKAELAELFKGVGFEKVTVTSDLERQVEVEFLRDVDLQQQDKARDAGAAPTDALSNVDKERRRAEAIAGKTDKRFTVDIEALQAAFDQQLKADFQQAFIAVESSAMVSPSVGSDLFNDGMLAILYSLIGILIYVTLRFDFRYAPGGVVSLAHDAIIVMGFVAAADLKFSLPIVAAVLTVIGYSINDTIVVYDRVRELYAGQKGKDLLELLNKSLNQTLSRTILTTGTTLLAILAILIFGGAQIRDFALAVFVGIAFGVYSSIYVAVPFVHYLDGYFQRKEAEKAEALKRNNNKKADAGDDKKAKATV